MQANPGKVQAIAAGEKTFEKNIVLKISDAEIKCEEVVKLLGIDIDYKLSFDQHISKSNRKAMNRNWSNQKANPALKTKTGNK